MNGLCMLGYVSKCVVNEQPLFQLKFSHFFLVSC